MTVTKDTFPNFHCTLTSQNSSLLCTDIIEKGSETSVEKHQHLFHISESSTQTIVTDQKLGEGGFANVFVGKQNLPNREIAVKRLKMNGQAARKLLLQEADIIGRLTHPNIIPIHEVHVDENGNVQILMKKIQGETLETYISRISEPRIRIQKGIEILIQVCHALEFAHANSILHRDIKCDNIMIGTFNEIYLMDWGLALDMQLQRPTIKYIVGTPTHLAPEMLSSDVSRLDVRTDVYLIGATLHYILMLTNRHDATNLKDIFVQIKDSEPYTYPSFIPPDIGDVVNKACSYDPDDRFETIKQFRIELEQFNKIWDARLLLEQNKEKLQEVGSITLSYSFSETELFLIQNSFVEILSNYEAALKIYPGYPEAIQGLTRVTVMMIEFYLSQNKPHEAMLLYKELPNQNEMLRELILEDISQLEAENETKELLARERDPRISFDGRRTLLLTTSAGMIVIALLHLGYEYISGFHLFPTHLLYLASAMLFGLLLGIGLGRQTLFTNQIGQELIRTLVTGQMIILLNHVNGVFYDIPSTFMLSIDLLILGLTCINLPITERGYQILSLCIFASSISIFCMNNHLLVLSIFWLCIISVWLLLFLDSIKQKINE